MNPPVQPRHPAGRLAMAALAAALTLVAVACVPETHSPTPTTTTTTTTPGAADTRPFVLDQGHIDLFELTYDQTTSALQLNVKDDTARYQQGKQFRRPQDVTIDVNPALTALQIPDEIAPSYEFLGGPGDTIYLLDEIQADGIPWPGWSTERLADTLPPGTEIPYEIGAVRFDIDVDGPGDVYTWANGPDGTAVNRYIDTSDDLPDVIATAPHVHQHTAWGFTETGDYHLTVTPSATTSTGATLTGPAANYHIHIGPPLVNDGEPPNLSLASSTTGPNAIGSTVDLAVSATPPVPPNSYRWYRWTDTGYTEIPGATGPVVSVTVANAFDQYLVTFVASSGRETAVAGIEVLGE